MYTNNTSDCIPIHVVFWNVQFLLFALYANVSQTCLIKYFCLSHWDTSGKWLIWNKKALKVRDLKSCQKRGPVYPQNTPDATISRRNFQALATYYSFFFQPSTTKHFDRAAFYWSVIIYSFLMTCFFGHAVVLSGEFQYWSLLRLKSTSCRSYSGILSFSIAYIHRQRTKKITTLQ